MIFLIYFIFIKKKLLAQGQKSDLSKVTEWFRQGWSWVSTLLLFQRRTSHYIKLPLTGVGGGREGRYVPKLSLSAAAFFFFKPKRQHESQQNLWNKKLTRDLLTILWVLSTFISATSSASVWLNTDQSLLPKTALTLIPTVSPAVNKNTSPTQEGHFTHSTGSGYTNYIWKLIFIKTCFSDCDEGQI